MDHTFINRRTMGNIILIISVPVFIIIWLAFFSNDTLPNNVSFSLSGFRELLTPLRLTEIAKIAFRALIISIAATTISFVLSYMLLSTSKVFQALFFVLITLPLLANESVRVFSWQYVLAENGLFNKLLALFFQHPISIFNGSNSINVYLVMIVTSIPFGIFINSAALQTIPLIYWKASGDLKLNSVNQFFKIAIPLSKFALLASAVIIFFISFSLSSEVNFLGGDSKVSIRNLVLSLMSASKFQSIFALGFIITLILLLIAGISKVFNQFKVRF